MKRKIPLRNEKVSLIILSALVIVVLTIMSMKIINEISSQDPFYSPPQTSIDVSPVITYGGVNLLYSVPAKNIVARYQFENNFLDTSGNNNHGHAINGLMLGNKYGNGIAIFDGIDDRMSVAQKDILNKINDMTISFWIELTPGITNEQGIINKGNYGNHEYPSISVRREGSMYLFNITSSSLSSVRSGAVASGAVASTLYRQTCSQYFNLTSSGWHLITISRDGLGNMFWYIDGRPKGQDMTRCVSVVKNHFYGTNPVIIGSKETGQNNLKASIDEVMIFNVTLLGSEVRAVYDSLETRYRECSVKVIS